jgi:hypothetical protein
MAHGAAVAKETREFPRLNTTEATRLLGATPNMINELIKRRVLRRGPDGKFDAVELVHSFQKHREEVLQRRWAVDGEAKARFARAKAAMAELKLQQQRRELLPANQVIAAYAAMVERCRSRLLAVPRKVGPRMQLARSTADAEGMMRREIEAALTEFSRLPQTGEPDDGLCECPL